MTKQSTYRATAVTIIFHVLAISIAFNILVVVFEFPDILRAPAAYRLTLFAENSNIVIPTYYVLALTGLTQVLLSMLLYQSFAEKNGLVRITAVFGVLTGVFQVLGFIRWPIVVPYFAEAMNGGMSMETIAFVEGMLNRYAGMAVGEHLGFLCQAVWTLLLGISMIKQDLFDKRLGWMGLGIGLLTLPMSMEPLGGVLAVFGELTWPVMGAWLIWLVLVAISLLRTKTEAAASWHISWKVAAVATAVWAILVIPTYFG
jgi:hypothetical protein